MYGRASGAIVAKPSDPDIALRRLMVTMVVSPSLLAKRLNAGSLACLFGASA
jgi:hypothetical protein